MEELSKSVLKIVIVCFIALSMSSCSRSDEAIAEQKKLIKEWKEMPQVENTRYRVSRNILLYDVTLEDGSRCVITNQGGVDCEFVK